MTRNFNEWLSHLRNNIASYDYYVDFPKVFGNVDDIKIELNVLNALIGEDDIRTKFMNILKRYPETLKCIPILLAVRKNEILVLDDGIDFEFSFKKMNYDAETYATFMEKSGLFNLMQHHIIGNLVDYVTGVETGLDSNGRKNRGGHLMENLVEHYIKKAGFIKNETYFKEMYIHEITEKWGIDLSAISNRGTTEKRFDYVVKTPENLYVIETNFYTSSGSKLNETARSYKTLANEIAPLPHVHFVWFTDGRGWISARHNLEETFDVLDTIYCIDDMEQGIISKVMI